MSSTAAHISPQAYVSPEATIGAGSVVEPFAFIEGNVTIGANCWIGPHAVIHSNTSLGDACKVFSGAVVGAVPQDLKFNGEASTVEIGDRTVIRECVTINRGTTDRMVTKVGSDCLLMAYCHLAHDVIIGNHVIIANSGNIAGHVTIEDWVIIEGMVGVQQFVTIGQHAFVAGGSLVRKNIPPFIKAAREPLSFIGVNSIGLRRRGFDNDKWSTSKTSTAPCTCKTRTFRKPCAWLKPNCHNRLRRKPSLLLYKPRTKASSAAPSDGPPE